MLMLIPFVYFFFHVRAIFRLFWPVLFWSFHGTLKITKIRSRMSFSPFSSVLPIFKHSLIELKCWNFQCGLGPPICMRLFKIFEIGFLSPPSGLPERIWLPPKSQIHHLLCDYLYTSNIIVSRIPNCYIITMLNISDVTHQLKHFSV